METFSALLALCAGNSPVTGEFPTQRTNDAELWCFLWSAPWINGWVNNRETGDLRRHRAHYDIVICYSPGIQRQCFVTKPSHIKQSHINPPSQVPHSLVEHQCFLPCAVAAIHGQHPWGCHWDNSQPLCKGHFVHGPCQRETTLQCIVVSHWLGACTERLLLGRWDDRMYRWR